MQELIESQKLRLKFEPYKNKKFLLFVTEVNVRNTLIPFFALLGVKKLSFMKNIEELRYEVRENVLEDRKNRYSICLMTYHHESIDNPAYIASLLQSIKQLTRKAVSPLPFLAFAYSNDSLEIQFGKSPKTRALTIRAAAKNGLKGLVIGNPDDPETADTFVDKLIEIIEDDELAKMTPFERYLRKLINKAYTYLNRIFGSAEEKEENINKAVGLFEEVLEQSKDNCEAILGKAMAFSSSSDQKKIREGCELFAKLELIGEDAERVYEGHAGACYKMAELVEDVTARDKWLLKGVDSLNSLTEWQINEYNAIKKIQQDYHDPELLRQLSNKYSNIASSLSEVGDKYHTTAINSYLKGITLDPKVVSNYKVIQLLKNSAKKPSDFLKIAQICATAKKNITGKEVDYLINEAEAYFSAGKEDMATDLFNSIDKYVSKEQIETWANDKTDGGKRIQEDSEKIAAFISFLNHRAIHFRKIEQYVESLDDLNTAISLDIDHSYFDIYYNKSKAMLSALKYDKETGSYTQKDAFKELFASINIAMNNNLETYETLLKAIKGDAILNPYIYEVKEFLKESNYSIPIFFK